MCVCVSSLDMGTREMDVMVQVNYKTAGTDVVGFGVLLKDTSAGNKAQVLFIFSPSTSKLCILQLILCFVNYACSQVFT